MLCVCVVSRQEELAQSQARLQELQSAVTMCRDCITQLHSQLTRTAPEWFPPGADGTDAHGDITAMIAAVDGFVSAVLTRAHTRSRVPSPATGTPTVPTHTAPSLPVAPDDLTRQDALAQIVRLSGSVPPAPGPASMSDVRQLNASVSRPLSASRRRTLSGVSGSAHTHSRQLRTPSPDDRSRGTESHTGKERARSWIKY